MEFNYPHVLDSAKTNWNAESNYPQLLGGGQQYLIPDDAAPEQETFLLFLENINCVVGTYVQQFLSTLRKELSMPYAQFEDKSFKEMTDILIYEDKLHCFDVSYIQQFLLFLLKWSTSQTTACKESIIGLLEEVQNYEPVPTGSPLPSVQLDSLSHTGTFVTRFDEVHYVSYEVMMTLKHALSQLLCLSLSTFQYVSWIKINEGCQINWKTFPENLNKIEDKLRCLPSTGALRVKDDYDPYNIEFTCSIENKQILLDGSPLLYPDLDGEIYLCMLYAYVNVNTYNTFPVRDH